MTWWATRPAETFVETVKVYLRKKSDPRNTQVTHVVDHSLE